MSASQHGVDVDVQAVREHYTQAIGAYQAAGEAIAAHPARVEPASFGQGFASQGARIAAALELIDATTSAYLRTRTHNWERIMQLASDVASTDEGNASGFGPGISAGEVLS